MEQQNQGTAQPFRVAGLGEVLWDLLPGGKQLGGAPANFAFHAQALGVESAIVSAVGTDGLGRELLETLASRGLSDEHIAVEDSLPTGTVDVRLDSQGKPEFLIHEEVAWDKIRLTETLQHLARGLSVVCFGTLAQRSPISRTTIRDMLRSTPPSCIRVFDVNLRQKFYTPAIVQESLGLSSCLKLNEDELPEVARLCSLRGTEREILRGLLDRFNLEMIALTRGEKGSLLFTKTESTEIEPPGIEVADTVGAGDAFTAALAVGMLRNLPIEVINRRAAALAGYVCTREGAMPEIPEDLRLLWKETRQ
jgi:fructokinase